MAPGGAAGPTVRSLEPTGPTSSRRLEQLPADPAGALPLWEALQGRTLGVVSWTPPSCGLVTVVTALTLEPAGPVTPGPGQVIYPLPPLPPCKRGTRLRPQASRGWKERVFVLREGRSQCVQEPGPAAPAAPATAARPRPGSESLTGTSSGSCCVCAHAVSFGPHCVSPSAVLCSGKGTLVPNSHTPSVSRSCGIGLCGVLSPHRCPAHLSHGRSVRTSPPAWTAAAASPRSAQGLLLTGASSHPCTRRPALPPHPDQSPHHPQPGTVGPSFPAKQWRDGGLIWSLQPIWSLWSHAVSFWGLEGGWEGPTALSPPPLSCTGSPGRGRRSCG